MVATLSVPDLIDNSRDTQIKQTSNPGNSLQCVKCIVTARKGSCGKIMFLHLSEIMFTGKVGGGLCPGGPCPGGVSVQGRSLSTRCLCLRGVFVQGGLCQGDPHTVKSGRYASYWNAFLFINFITREILKVSFINVFIYLFILFYFILFYFYFYFLEKF